MAQGRWREGRPCNFWNAKFPRGERERAQGEEERDRGREMKGKRHKERIGTHERRKRGLHEGGRTA
jgi:hypothetical protein